MNNENISIEDPMQPRAMSVYNAEGSEEFPVLKAFQQYIDAEQAKSRKRLITLGIFFSVIMFLVIAIFVTLLIGASERNQKLNDRLVEFVMKERERTSAPAPVVVQPPAAQDNSAVVSLAAKVEAMQAQMLAQQTKELEKSLPPAKKVDPPAAKPNGPTQEQLEIQRLKALLDAERQKAAAEQERKRQEELEAYRRRQYPELYGLSPRKESTKKRPVKRRALPVDLDDDEDEADAREDADVEADETEDGADAAVSGEKDDLEDLAGQALSYFKKNVPEKKKSAAKPQPKKVVAPKPAENKKAEAPKAAESAPAEQPKAAPAPTPAPSPSAATPAPTAKPVEKKVEPEPEQYSIPVDVHGKSTNWLIPRE